MRTLVPLPSSRCIASASRTVFGILVLSALVPGSLWSQSVTVNYLYPSTSAVLESNGTQAIAPGGATFYIFGSILQTVVTPNSITITNPTGITALMDTVSFDGPQYIFPTVGSTGVTIVGVAIDPSSNVPGFDSSSITFASHEVRLNLQSLVLFPGLNIKVNLSAAVLTTTATTVNFSYQPGGGTPPSQTIQLSNTGAPVPFTATFNGGTTSPAGLVTIAPTSGTTPSALVLSLNPAVLSTLAVGTYSGTVVVSSSAIPGGDQSITVTLVVAAAGVPAIQSVLNGASFAPGPVSPGEIISIFGSNMGPTPGSGFAPLNGKIDVTLAGTQVLFDNVPAPLIFVSSAQINAIVPYEVASLVGTATGTKVTVVRGAVASSPLLVAVAATSPAIFSTLQTGNGQGAILNQDLSPNTANNPAAKGSVVLIYGTGEGSLTPFVPTGTISGPSLPLPKPSADVSVTIGGVPATIQYAGEAPGLVAGVIQINATIPTDIGSGPQQVVLKIGSNSNSQQVINVAAQ